MKTRITPRLAGIAVFLACTLFGVDAVRADVRDPQDRATVELNVRDQGVWIVTRTSPLSR